MIGRKVHDNPALQFLIVFLAGILAFVAVLAVAGAAGAAGENPWHALGNPEAKPDLRTYFRCNGTVGVYVIAADWEQTVGISTVNPDPNCPAK